MSTTGWERDDEPEKNPMEKPMKLVWMDDTLDDTSAHRVRILVPEGSTNPFDAFAVVEQPEEASPWRAMWTLIPDAAAEDFGVDRAPWQGNLSDGSDDETEFNTSREAESHAEDQLVKAAQREIERLERLVDAGLDVMASKLLKPAKKKSNAKKPARRRRKP